MGDDGIEGVSTFFILDLCHRGIEGPLQMSCTTHLIRDVGLMRQVVTEKDENGFQEDSYTKASFMELSPSKRILPTMITRATPVSVQFQLMLSSLKSEKSVFLRTQEDVFFSNQLLPKASLVSAKIFVSEKENRMVFDLERVFFVREDGQLEAINCQGFCLGEDGEEGILTLFAQDCRYREVEEPIQVFCTAYLVRNQDDRLIGQNVFEKDEK